MAFKPIDPKRDEYRRYLERGGIIESLTKVFVRILKERPEDPTQYLLQNLGDARLQADNIAYLQSELEDARNEIRRLTEIIRGINPDLLVESSNSNGEGNNENNISEVVSANNEPEDPTCLPKSDEQNYQSGRESPEVNSLEEGLQNTQISETKLRGDGRIVEIKSEQTSSAE